MGNSSAHSGPVTRSQEVYDLLISWAGWVRMVVQTFVIDRSSGIPGLFSDDFFTLTTTTKTSIAQPKWYFEILKCIITIG